jgi:hypothetical protein
MFFYGDLIIALWYLTNMSKNHLNKTNPYLEDSIKRRKGLVTSVASSCAIEGIYEAITEKDLDSVQFTQSIPLHKTSKTGKSHR